ncbi:MAG: DUF1192 domain-containing protein [Asticcacaulis sp.]
MSDEDGFSSGFRPGPKLDTPLSALVHEDLSVYSVTDLKERIATLDGEISRTRSILDSKQSGRSAADALFSFKGS